MRCPFCASIDTQVKDSRVAEDGSYIKRRRFCSECGSRFTTFERVQLKEVMVKKSNGIVVPFEREKLTKYVKLACKKRPITDERIEKIVSSIQRQLEASGEAEISSREIGVLVMDMLSNLDIVAYIRFASVYYNFDKKEDFLKFIDTIKKEISSLDDDEITSKSSYNRCSIIPEFSVNNSGKLKEDDLFNDNKDLKC